MCRQKLREGSCGSLAQCPWVNRGRSLKANKCRGHLLIFFLPRLEKDGGDKAPETESTYMLPASFPSAAREKPAWAPPPAPARNLTLSARISLGRATRVHLHVRCLQIRHRFWCATEHWSLPVKPVLSPVCHRSAGLVLNWRLSSLLPRSGIPLLAQPSVSSSSSFVPQLLGNQEHVKVELEKLKKTYDSQQQKLEERV